MSALPSGPELEAQLAQLQLPAKPTARGFLHIVRHGTGLGALYVLTYHWLDRRRAHAKPVLAEGAQLLIELLERIGVNVAAPEVRGALEYILRLGSANIPDLWLSDEELVQKGLVES